MLQNAKQKEKILGSSSKFITKMSLLLVYIGQLTDLIPLKFWNLQLTYF